jgi:hypothetical protein
MMDIDRVRIAAFERIKTAVQDAVPGTPVYSENTKYQQPRDTPWVLFTFIPNISYKREMGGRSLMHMGVINCYVQVPGESGQKTSNAIIQAIIDSCTDVKLALAPSGYLTLCHNTVRQRGLVNGWFVRNVLVEYKYQDERNT